MKNNKQKKQWLSSGADGQFKSKAQCKINTG